MVKWQRPSAELTALFDACLPKGAGVERRQMFGCPCAFVNGNMFTGLHEQRLIVRLADAERTQLLQSSVAKPFVVMGRTMREYVTFERAVERSPDELRAWIRKALAYAGKLPPEVARRASRS